MTTGGELTLPQSCGYPSARFGMLACPGGFRPGFFALGSLFAEAGQLFRRAVAPLGLSRRRRECRPALPLRQVALRGTVAHPPFRPHLRIRKRRVDFFRRDGHEVGLVDRRLLVRCFDDDWGHAIVDTEVDLRVSGLPPALGFRRRPRPRERSRGRQIADIEAGHFGVAVGVPALHAFGAPAVGFRFHLFGGSVAQQGFRRNFLAPEPAGLRRLAVPVGVAAFDALVARVVLTSLGLAQPFVLTPLGFTPLGFAPLVFTPLLVLFSVCHDYSSFLLISFGGPVFALVSHLLGMAAGFAIADSIRKRAIWA